jgi:hypothetical protein
MAYLLLGCRCLIGLVFVLSVASKLRGRSAFDAFVSSVGDLRLVRAGLSRLVGFVVVGAEITVVGLIAVPGTVVFGFALSAALLAAFCAAILVSLRKGVRAPCRCFGPSSTPLGVAHIVRNLILLAAAVTGGTGALRSTAAPSHPAGIALSLLLATVVSVPSLLFFDDFVALFTGPAPAGLSPTSVKDI